MFPASLCAPMVYTANLCLWAKFLYIFDLFKFFAFRLFKLLEYDIVFLYPQHTEKDLSNRRFSINICWMNEWMSEWIWSKLSLRCKKLHYITLGMIHASLWVWYFKIIHGKPFKWEEKKACLCFSVFSPHSKQL